MTTNTSLPAMDAETKCIRFYVLRDPISKEVKYVGKTEVSLQDRLKRHLWDGKSLVKEWIVSLKIMGLRPLIEEIGRIDKGEDWQSIERMLISEYRSFGYKILNVTDGGLGGSGQKMSEYAKQYARERKVKTVFSFNPKTNQVKEYHSFLEAAKDIGVAPGFVSKCVSTKGKCKGLLMSTSRKFSISPVAEKYRRPILCTLPDGSIRNFRSAHTAGKELGLCPSFIRKVLSGKYSHYKKYGFKYESDVQLVELGVLRLKDK